MLPIGSRIELTQTIAKPRRRIGLGDALAWAISISTLGQGKRIAKTVARIRGKKTCGCEKRRKWLNRWRLWG